MRRIGLISGLCALVLVSGCGKKTPPAATPQPGEPSRPTPTNPLPTDDDAARRARDADEARRLEVTRLRAQIETMVFYDYDRADLNAAARTILEEKARLLNAHTDVTVRIEGHADERGSVEYNLALSLRRAESARSFLVDYGIDRNRIEVVPYGEERPLDTGTSEAAYARNRRSEFRILSGLMAEN
jgi:peptidoglycan-associated lipoprotein